MARGVISTWIAWLVVLLDGIDEDGVPAVLGWRYTPELRHAYHAERASRGGLPRSAVGGELEVVHLDGGRLRGFRALRTRALCCCHVTEPAAHDDAVAAGIVFAAKERAVARLQSGDLFGTAHGVVIDAEQVGHERVAVVAPVSLHEEVAKAFDAVCTHRHRVRRDPGIHRLQAVGGPGGQAFSDVVTDRGATPVVTGDGPVGPVHGDRDILTKEP